MRVFLSVIPHVVINTDVSYFNRVLSDESHIPESEVSGWTFSMASIRTDIGVNISSSRLPSSL